MPGPPRVRLLVGAIVLLVGGLVLLGLVPFGMADLRGGAGADRRRAGGLGHGRQSTPFPQRCALSAG